MLSGQPEKFKSAILACPCGCGERIDVCLMPKMGADTARRTCLIVSLDLGAGGEMRQPLLASAEQNRLVEELDLQ